MQNKLEEAGRESWPYHSYYNKKLHNASIALSYAPVFPSDLDADDNNDDGDVMCNTNTNAY